MRSCGMKPSIGSFAAILLPIVLIVGAGWLFITQPLLFIQILGTVIAVGLGVFLVLLAAEDWIL